jgi:N-acetyl-anhydromuramyl-L-alanine amidase AmpD
MADTVPFPPLVQIPTPPARLPIIKRVVPSNVGVRRFVIGRPNDGLPSSIVKHSTVTNGPRSSSASWLSTHPLSGVSCHTLANRDGSLTEICPPMWTAYHAGTTLPGYGNGESLGLEIENSSNGMGRVEAYPAAQIISAAYRVATWQFSFGIPDARVKAHREIAVFGTEHPQAGQLGRKFDPVGPFPDEQFDEWRLRWLEFLRSLPAALHEVFII